jgi:NhaP-type Na+/H+ or K+/H+ antiporter
MLIGAQVLLRSLSAQSLQTAATILALATSVRLLVTYLSVSTSPTLVIKERLFVCLAWLPKATVQAAVGGAALDQLVAAGLPDAAIQRGELVLMSSVLIILVTAPVGALAIHTLGPAWLAYDGPDNAVAARTTFHASVPANRVELASSNGGSTGGANGSTTSTTDPTTPVSQSAGTGASELSSERV